MDLVVGPQEGSGAVLLTLTERRTRQELIFKLPDKRAASVRAVFDKLERTTPDFYQRFKSITTDNGPEFLEHDLLVKSVLGGRRFTVFINSLKPLFSYFTAEPVQEKTEGEKTAQEKLTDKDIFQKPRHSASLPAIEKLAHKI